MTGTIRGASAARAAAMAALLVVAGGCGAEPEPSLFADAKRVRVGAKTDQPGTGYQPHGGTFTGLDITVTRELLKRIKAGPADFGGVISKDRAAELRSKRFDLVAATFSITDERMRPVDATPPGEGLDFVGPYATTPQGMLVRKEDEGRYHTLDDLNGKRVCVWGGTTSDVELNKLPQRFTVRVEEDAGYCIKALKANDTDAVSTDLLILYGFMDSDSTLTVVPKISFGRPNQYGIALAKGHRKDCERLRDALKEYATDNDWTRDFDHDLPKVPKELRDAAKPTESSIDALSCKDRPDAGHAG
ncbi:transporter substrate-binding domain-containing protein [Kitasatospora sp. NPDC056783]|uniref:transporter substrate-binding domain-containing protein n=1 Tax=Kitasatospora sp. NPDC056783 TaxID=3345943 RepID=UPI00369F5382